MSDTKQDPFRHVGRPARSRTTGNYSYVSEDSALRTWRPEEKCPAEKMDIILTILLKRGRSYQADIVEEVEAELGVKRGTAAAYVSGALLAFREAGWVRCLTPSGEKRPVWEIIED